MNNSLRLLTFLVCIHSLTNCVCAQATIRLRSDKSMPAAILVEGCSAAVLTWLSQSEPSQQSQHLQVFVKGAFDNGDAPAVLGNVLIKDNTVYFEPKYPLEAGVEYLVRFRDAKENDWQTQVLALPKKKIEPSTVVSQVYPTSGRLPQNLLKFYVYFSAP